METSRGESKRRQHRKTEREEGGWSRRQRGEDNPRAYCVRIHQRPLLLLLLFIFYFLPLISTFPLPCAAPDSKNVETFPRQGACFTLSYAYVCVRTLIKDNNKKLWSVCVCVFVWVTVRDVGVWIGSGGRLDLALRLMSLLCFCNEVCHENSVCACTRASTHVSAFSASLV